MEGCLCINSLRLSDAYMSIISPSLFQIKACRPVGAKPLSEPMPEPFRTNFIQISIEILIFSFKKMHLRMTFEKCRPFWLDLSVLTPLSLEVTFENNNRIDIMIYWYIEGWTKWQIFCWPDHIFECIFFGENYWILIEKITEGCF